MEGAKPTPLPVLRLGSIPYLSYPDLASYLYLSSLSMIQVGFLSYLRKGRIYGANGVSGFIHERKKRCKASVTSRID
jgi:hypothetical protein